MKRPASRCVLVSIFALGCSGDPAGTASNETDGSPPIGSTNPPPTPPPADGGAGSTGDAGLPRVPVPPERVPATGLSIRELAVFQGVKVPIAEDGQEIDPSDTVHVVAGRRGLLRVYVEPHADFVAREITAELSLLRDGAETITLEASREITDASSEADLQSTLNIELPADAIEPDTRYRVRLLAEPGQPEGDATGAVFPKTGDLPLRAWDTGPGLRVKLVPVELDGRVPETGAEQLQRYRDELEAIFPARSVELTVRDVYHYSGNVSPGGYGISTLLGAVTNLRQKDGAPDEVYYYGAFEAADSYSEYCSGGCTTGICHLVTSHEDTYSRACVGVGFEGNSSAGTMAHELGHAHGLRHAPCGGPAGPDPSYPYSGAKIGSWGFDLHTAELIEPSTRDFMSYCSPSFISDYNFDRLIHRMSKIALADRLRAPEPASQWQSAEVAPDGSLRWGEIVSLRHRPHGEPRSAVFELGGIDRESVTLHYYPFSELGGGTLLVPRRATPWDAIRIADLAGRPSVRALAPAQGRTKAWEPSGAR